MFVTIITGLSIIFAWGASIVAESSLPGEALYPIKVNINESFQSAFAVSAENEATLQLWFIEERINEKQELEAQWKLTVEIASKIDAKLWAHRERFEEEKESMKNNNKLESANNLEVKFNSLVSLFWDDSSTGSLLIKASSNSEADTWNNNSESKSETNVSVKAESNTQSNVDTQKVINTTSKASLDVSTKAKIESKAAVNTTINNKARVEAIVDTSKSAIVNKVNDVAIESKADSETSINTATKLETKESTKVNVTGSNTTKTSTNISNDKASVKPTIEKSIELDSSTKIGL